jgi:hypothetical protein
MTPGEQIAQWRYTLARELERFMHTQLADLVAFTQRTQVCVRCLRGGCVCVSLAVLRTSRVCVCVCVCVCVAGSAAEVTCVCLWCVQAALAPYLTQSVAWNPATLDACMELLMTALTKHTVWTKITSLFVKDSAEVLTCHGVGVDEGCVSSPARVAAVIVLLAFLQRV